MSLRVQKGNKDKRLASERESGAVNVQVAVRCRRLNKRETSSGDQLIVKCDSLQREITMEPTPGQRSSLGSKDGKKKFTYDHVFGPDSSQNDVYQGVVKPIVDQVLEGYNCTVFAYGQTGTGKTHTMEGQRTDAAVDISDKRLPENAGMIPRAVEQVFGHLRSITAEYSVNVSHLELYNEQLTDLLRPKNGGKNLRMYNDNSKGVVVDGLEEFVVKSEEEIFQFLDKSVLRRKTAGTRMNRVSSRFHSVFTITIHTKESRADGSELLKADKLNLVDLAGSENVRRSGALAKRAREAGNINQSLSTLGRVISALVEKHPHIPYRDSKLTRLLQESLGGKNKTCIIATATLGSSSFEETKSTLDYAHRARSIKNRPTANQKIVLMKEFTDENSKLKRELEQAADENSKLKRLLEKSRSGKAVSTPVRRDEQLIGQLELMKEQRTMDQEKQRALESNNAELAKALGNKNTQIRELEAQLEKARISQADFIIQATHHQATRSKPLCHNDGLSSRFEGQKGGEKENQHMNLGENRQLIRKRETHEFPEDTVPEDKENL